MKLRLVCVETLETPAPLIIALVLISGSILGRLIINLWENRAGKVCNYRRGRQMNEAEEEEFCYALLLLLLRRRHNQFATSRRRRKERKWMFDDGGGRCGRAAVSEEVL